MTCRRATKMVGPGQTWEKGNCRPRTAATHTAATATASWNAAKVRRPAPRTAASFPIAGTKSAKIPGTAPSPSPSARRTAACAATACVTWGKRAAPRTPRSARKIAAPQPAATASANRSNAASRASFARKIAARVATACASRSNAASRARIAPKIAARVATACANPSAARPGTRRNRPAHSIVPSAATTCASREKDRWPARWTAAGPAATANAWVAVAARTKGPASSIAPAQPAATESATSQKTRPSAPLTATRMSAATAFANQARAPRVATTIAWERAVTAPAATWRASQPAPRTVATAVTAIAMTNAPISSKMP